MKSKKAEIEVKEQLHSKGIVHQLIMEVEEEKRQLQTTKSVNKATSELHYKILSDFVSALNKEIEVVGKGFEPIETIDVVNDYEFYMSKLSSLGWRGTTYYLHIVGSNRNKINNIHTTYAGEYNLYFGIHEDYNSNKVVDSIAEIVDMMKFDLKEELRKTL